LFGWPPSLSRGIERFWAVKRLLARGENGLAVHVAWFATELGGALSKRASRRQVPLALLQICSGAAASCRLGSNVMFGDGSVDRRDPTGQLIEPAPGPGSAATASSTAASFIASSVNVTGGRLGEFMHHVRPFAQTIAPRFSSAIISL
jgi:hypothetical protein